MAVGQPVHVALMAVTYAIVLCSIPFFFAAKCVQELSFRAAGRITFEMLLEMVPRPTGQPPKP